MPLPSRAIYGQVLVFLAGSLLLAQLGMGEVRATRTSRETVSAPRLLNSEEGRAVVNAAWEHREQVDKRLDCSHLVHEVYQFAGLPYPYATSSTLYTGVKSFARVKSPQPGDLIVWRGHVGIVVNPREHTFYSSKSSGLETDAYNAGYWRARGRPRFYRYILSSGESLVLAKAQPESPSAEPPIQVVTVPIREEDRDSRSEVAAVPAKASPRSGDAPVVNPVLSRPRAPYEIPPAIRIVTTQAQPKPDDVAEAISELSNGAGDVLRSDDLLKLAYPVVIFDQFRVERVKIKGDRGWAEVRIEFRVFLNGDRIQVKRRHEKQRWEVRRRGADWLVFTPLDRVYVPSEVAVPVLADQLALLTRSDRGFPDRAAAVQQQAQFARLLSVLLETK